MLMGFFTVSIFKETNLALEMGGMSYIMNWVLLKFIRAYIGKERAELDRLIETYRDKGAIS